MDIILFLKSFYHLIRKQYKAYKLTSPQNFGRIDVTDVIENRGDIRTPHLIYLDKYVKIRVGFKFISYGSKLTIGRFTTLANNVTIVTGNHCPTVGVAQHFCDRYHINDIECDMIIGEDVWVGVNATLIHGARISRGAVVGACALVNRFVPPYAVVAGVPARIIAVKFSKEQIIEHERILYKPDDRIKMEELDEIFEQYYANKKILGIDSLSDDDRFFIDKVKPLYYED